MKKTIALSIQAQPDDVTCGPSCLFSLYRYYGDTGISLRQVIDQVEQLQHGGTLLELLACHALRRGYHATLYSYHVDLLDPSWFADDGGVHDPQHVRELLGQQLAAKKGDARSRLATRSMQEFLDLGGDLRMDDLTPALLSRHIAAGTPILASLSSTYLYREARETDEGVADDIVGHPQGHFVMLVGYTGRTREVLVADPLDPNPPYHASKYRVRVERLVNAIMLGIVTHDANLLVLRPRAEKNSSKDDR